MSRNKPFHKRSYDSLFVTFPKFLPKFRTIHDPTARPGHPDRPARRFRRPAPAHDRRRAKRTGLPPTVNRHSFRATGITNYLSNGHALEDARAITAHESSQTTRLYDHSGDKITLDEIERIRFCLS